MITLNRKIAILAMVMCAITAFFAHFNLLQTAVIGLLFYNCLEDQEKGEITMRLAKIAILLFYLNCLITFDLTSLLTSGILLIVLLCMHNGVFSSDPEKTYIGGGDVLVLPPLMFISSHPAVFLGSLAGMTLILIKGAVEGYGSVRILSWIPYSITVYVLVWGLLIF